MKKTTALRCDLCDRLKRSVNGTSIGLCSVTNREKTKSSHCDVDGNDMNNSEVRKAYASNSGSSK